MWPKGVARITKLRSSSLVVVGGQFCGRSLQQQHHNAWECVACVEHRQTQPLCITIISYWWWEVIVVVSSKMCKNILKCTHAFEKEAVVHKTVVHCTQLCGTLRFPKINDISVSYFLLIAKDMSIFLWQTDAPDSGQSKSSAVQDNDESNLVCR